MSASPFRLLLASSLLALTAGTLLSTPCLSQTSRVFDDLAMHSEILDMDRKYAIYLPPGYDTSERSYPVLYLLHGKGDDQTGWVQFGEVQHIADKAIREGTATPMVIVMPDANTSVVGYFNDVTDAWRYEDFFFDELIPYVESQYRIKSEKRYRAVAGLSMGGGGSFMYAMHRPDMFSSAAPLSALTSAATVEQLKEQATSNGARPPGDDVVQAYYERHSAVELARNLPADDLRAVRWYIDCGDDDYLYEGNALIHLAMRKREIPHEYRVRDGAHRWPYWREALPEVLAFVSEPFHK